MTQTTDYSGYCHAGASFEERLTELSTGVKLMSIVFTPPLPSDGPDILFVPGLASVIDNFRDTVIELTSTHRVIYVETREKSSSHIGPGHRFSVREITDDLIEFAEREFGGRPFIMAGYSLGATVIAEAAGRMKHRPEKIILLEPNTSFNFPGWLLILSFGARVIYNPLKPFLKWYLRTFRINMAEDREMYMINCRILDNAEPVRIGRAIRDLKPYRMNGCLGRIATPAMVVVASSDRFHSHDEGLFIARSIAGSVCRDLGDNTRTHSREAGEVIREFAG